MQQGQPAARLEVGRHGGLLSWSRRIGPHVTLPAEREPSPGAPVSRLPRLTPASLRGELLVPHHPASRPGRWWCMGRVGPLVLALTRGGRLDGLAREAASLRPYDTIQNTKDVQRLLCEYIYNVYSKVSQGVSGLRSRLL